MIPVSDKADVAGNNRLQYPSTPQDFKSFDSLKELWHDGNMLTPKERSELYNDCTKVILEMAKMYNVFSRCIYFNLEMLEKYQSNIDRYIRYYTNIIKQIDIFLQKTNSSAVHHMVLPSTFPENIVHSTLYHCTIPSIILIEFLNTRGSFVTLL